jgi:hypothetical protein
VVFNVLVKKKIMEANTININALVSGVLITKAEGLIARVRVDCNEGHWTIMQEEVQNFTNAAEKKYSMVLQVTPGKWQQIVDGGLPMQDNPNSQRLIRAAKDALGLMDDNPKLVIIPVQQFKDKLDNEYTLAVRIRPMDSSQ